MVTTMVTMADTMATAIIRVTNHMIDMMVDTVTASTISRWRITGGTTMDRPADTTTARTAASTVTTAAVTTTAARGSTTTMGSAMATKTRPAIRSTITMPRTRSIRTGITAGSA